MSTAKYNSTTGSPLPSSPSEASPHALSHMTSLSRSSFSRRSFMKGSLAAVLGLGLAACSDGTSKTNTVATPSAAPAFPVSIEHNFGSTTIASAPQRVVTVGYVTADVVASLGVIPIAAGAVTWGGNDKNSNPWLDDQIANLGANEPLFYDEKDGVNFDAISAASPDLILCMYGNLSEDDYEKLSTIAPTVTYPKEGAQWQCTWEEATRQVGTALGRSALAEELIAQTQVRLETIKTNHSELANKTIIAGYLDPTSSTPVQIYAPNDARTHLFTDIGLSLAGIYDSIDFNGDYYTTWSSSRISDLDSSIFYTWLSSGDMKSTILKDSTLSTILAIQKGGLLALSDKQQYIAMYSTIGINWLLDKTNFINDLVSSAQGKGDTTTPESTDESSSAESSSAESSSTSTSSSSSPSSSQSTTTEPDS